MSSRIRSVRFLTIPALLLALGCASTSTTPVSETDPPEARATGSQVPGDVTIGQASKMPAPVYFDTDSALLRPDTRDTLKQYAKSILDHPEWGVLMIDGHCDERGSGEYNLALGRRRAAAVERYLLDLGVPPSRLDTRSFGEEKPVVAGHDEKAWRYNRRSEFRSEALASASR